MPSAEQLVGEQSTDGGFEVRYLETEAGLFFAAGSPGEEDGWVYLADSESLEELVSAVEALLSDGPATRVILAMAALLGVEWNDVEMVPLLAEQCERGKQLMRDAPNTVEQPRKTLRRIREQAAAAENN